MTAAEEIQPPRCPKCDGRRTFLAHAPGGFVGTWCDKHGRMGLAEHELPDAWPCPTCGTPMSPGKSHNGTYVYTYLFSA